MRLIFMEHTTQYGFLNYKRAHDVHPTPCWELDALPLVVGQRCRVAVTRALCGGADESSLVTQTPPPPCLV